MELHEYISEFIEEFKNDLRVKTTTYMIDNMYDIQENPQIMETSIIDGPESFSLMIKNGDNVLYNRYLDEDLPTESKIHGRPTSEIKVHSEHPDGHFFDKKINFGIFGL